MRNMANIFFLLLIWAGGITLSETLSDPSILKAPLILLGSSSLVILNIKNIRSPMLLIPFLVFWSYGYFRLTQTGLFQETAMMVTMGDGRYLPSSSPPDSNTQFPP
jgi:hypothetical protein